MKLTAGEFRNWEHKSITLLGMSGVGKTRLANLLRNHNWFHFSGDYRIGTRYLDEAILDNIKQKAMQVPFLRDLLRSDSIYIHNNITVDNLNPVSSFLGKLGNPELGGLGLEEFKLRQAMHHEAEVKTMRDVPEFIRKAHDIYGYKHFINDAGGSMCELDDPQVLDLLFEHTLVLYIKASEEDEQALIDRAVRAPKPLYYREEFLAVELGHYMQEKNLPYVAMIDPDEFVRWIFPRLFRARIPRYSAIAEKYGYTITTAELATVNTEADFVQLLETVIARQQ
ncbi:MAG: ATPase [Gammaproteobacteria bacterium]|nr:ATPase [Gammaproteobacteria bacterium]MDH5778533.1 ATPase [Gammaproteobacteria bacterium]